MSLRPTPARKIIKLLNKIGFEVVRQHGSHVILKHADGRGLLSKIIKDTRMSKEEFLRLLEET